MHENCDGIYNTWLKYEAERVRKKDIINIFKFTSALISDSGHQLVKDTIEEDPNAKTGMLGYAAEVPTEKLE